MIPHANYGCFWFGNIRRPEDIWPMLSEIGQTAEVHGRNVLIVDMFSKSNVTFMFDDGREFMAQADDGDACKRTCDISRKLDGCATSLRMYSMTAAAPIGTLLENLAKAAMNASEKLRDRDTSVSTVFGEITMLAQETALTGEQKKHII